jgi:hypothetical protein
MFPSNRHARRRQPDRQLSFAEIGDLLRQRGYETVWRTLVYYDIPNFAPSITCRN